MAPATKKVNRTIEMENVTDFDVRIELGGSPGDGVTEFIIKPGESQAFHENLCKPVPGAGRQALPPILARKSTRTFPDGVRRPTLIPKDDAPKVREKYKAELDKWIKAGRPMPKVSKPEAAAR